MDRRKNKNSCERHSIKDFSVGIPMELGSAPVMEICSNREITLDGCRGIAEYTEYEIRLRTSHGIIAIDGKNLNIKYLSTSSIVVQGVIKKIEFSD